MTDDDHCVGLDWCRSISRLSSLVTQRATKPQLIGLKERFLDLTGGTITVFLSSDGQSIHLGSNWVAGVEAALRAAKLMFVFVSPNSLQSPWLYFEAGHAYSQGIAVIPVGLFGVDIGRMSPPMNLLQGFNATDAASLNNLIATTNSTFGFQHKPGFVHSDFDALAQQSGLTIATKLVGQHADAVREITFSSVKENANLDQLAQHLSPLHGFTRGTEGILVAGARVSFPDRDWNEVRADVDPLAPPEVFESVEAGFRLMKPRTEDSLCPYDCLLLFEEHVTYEPEPYRQLSRLRPNVSVADPKLSGDSQREWLSWNSVAFTLGSSPGQTSRHSPHRFLWAKTSATTFREARLGELVDLLFERGVVRYVDL